MASHYGEIAGWSTTVCSAIRDENDYDAWHADCFLHFSCMHAEACRVSSAPMQVSVLTREIRPMQVHRTLRICRKEPSLSCSMHERQILRCLQAASDIHWRHNSDPSDGHPACNSGFVCAENSIASCDRYVVGISKRDSSKSLQARQCVCFRASACGETECRNVSTCI